MKTYVFGFLFLLSFGFSSSLFASVPAPYIPELSWDVSKNAGNLGMLSEVSLTENSFRIQETNALLVSAESYIEEEISEAILLGTPKPKRNSSHLSYLNAVRYMMTCA